jgi:hypothetical protein
VDAAALALAFAAVSAAGVAACDVDSLIQLVKAINATASVMNVYFMMVYFDEEKRFF